VQDFDVARYLGTWYEIARLDHSFERGLDHVTAQYALREDGGISVTNRGFLPSENRWKEAQGKAYFVNAPDEGYLKVSFFGPFYGGYHVIALDRETYRHALISGPSREYLWILARDRKLPEATLKSLVDQARQAGFDTGKLIHVEQNRQSPPLPHKIP
jgi:apolipoprotein D and lipocalin family protein